MKYEKRKIEHCIFKGAGYLFSNYSLLEFDPMENDANICIKNHLFLLQNDPYILIPIVKVSVNWNGMIWNKKKLPDRTAKPAKNLLSGGRDLVLFVEYSVVVIERKTELDRPEHAPKNKMRRLHVVKPNKLRKAFYYIGVDHSGSSVHYGLGNMTDNNRQLGSIPKMFPDLCVVTELS